MSKTALYWRLKAACHGKPATIPWPHRLLHEAATSQEIINEILDHIEADVEPNFDWNHDKLQTALNPSDA